MLEFTAHFSKLFWFSWVVFKSKTRVDAETMASGFGQL